MTPFEFAHSWSEAGYRNAILRLRIPLPPTKNNLHRPGKDRATGKLTILTTDEYEGWKDWQMALRTEINQSTWRCTSDPVAMWITVHPADYSADSQNFTEALLDILQGVVYADDKQVRYCYVHQGRMSVEPYAAIEVWSTK